MIFNFFIIGKPSYTHNNHFPYRAFSVESAHNLFPCRILKLQNGMFRFHAAAKSTGKARITNRQHTGFAANSLTDLIHCQVGFLKRYLLPLTEKCHFLCCFGRKIRTDQHDLCRMLLQAFLYGIKARNHLPCLPADGQ